MDVVVAVVRIVVAVDVALDLDWACVLLCLRMFLVLILLRVHVWYLHWDRAFLMCSSSLRSSLVVAQTVIAYV